MLHWYGELHRDWRGWTLSIKGELVSPFGLTFRPGDLNAEPIYRKLSAVQIDPWSCGERNPGLQEGGATRCPEPIHR